MGWEDCILSMRRALHRLDEFDTVSPFSRTFYQLVCDWIEECGPLCAELQDAFASFLDVEVQRHRAIAGDSKERTSIIDWVSIRYRAEPSLRHLIARLEALPAEMSRQGCIRQLILVDCYAQVGEDEKAIGALRSALATGADHPVVHFALGYHLYLNALKRHCRYDAINNRFSTENRKTFQRLCEESVAAFRAGFSESPFDAQLHWWIACVQETLGNMGEARESYTKAKELDPNNFAAEVEHRLRDMPRPILDATTQEEKERLSQLPPITSDEVKRISQELKKIRNVTDIMPGASPQP